MAGFCEEPLRAIGASAQASGPPSPLAVDPLAVQWVFPKGRVFTVLMPCLLPYFVLTWKGIIRSTPGLQTGPLPSGWRGLPLCTLPSYLAQPPAPQQQMLVPLWASSSVSPG